MTKNWTTPLPQAALALVLAGGLGLALSLAAPAAAKNVEIQAAAGAVTWQVAAPNAGTTLVVHGEDGFVQRRSFEAGQAPHFLAPGDGTYQWQLVVQPVLSEAQKAELKAARAKGEEAAAPKLGGFLESGAFTVSGGSVALVGPDASQPGGGDGDVPVNTATFAEDVIVQGSLCAGIDCVTGESFGFDTIRLKENNLRIKFDDTSSSSGFPANDWQLTANDSATGGINKFSIEDITGAKVPFTVEAGAATNALYVDDAANVGLGTASPVLDLHIATGNTPALRLEQNASGGFTAQTWDIGANEANFFVRDVTGGSKLSLRIRPGAPTSSIDVSSTGLVGIGTASPAEKVHVKLTDGVADTALLLENNQAVRFDMTNTSTANGGSATTWFWQVDNDAPHTFRLSKQGGGGTVVAITSRANGDGTTMVVDGSVSATSFITTSTKSAKTDGKQIDALEMLEKVASLPIEQWRFKSEAEGIAHVGPYAEDFKAAFGLGHTDQAIELQDASGVALVAIKALYQEIQELKKQNAELRRQLAPRD